MAITWSKYTPADWVLTNSDKTAARTNNSAQGWTPNIQSSILPTSGKLYFEITCDSNTYHDIGFCEDTAVVSGTPRNDSGFWIYAAGYAYSYFEGVYDAAPVFTCAIGDVIGFAIDIDSGKCWLSKNGTFEGDPVAGTGEWVSGLPSSLRIVMADYYCTSSYPFTLYPAETDQTYSAPTGFTAVDDYVPLPDFDVSVVPAYKKLKLTLDSSEITADQTDFPLDVFIDGSISLHKNIFEELNVLENIKTIVLDIATCWGGSLLGFRTIEFYLEGVLVDVQQADCTGYSSSTYTGYSEEIPFDVDTVKTGSHSSSNCWLSFNVSTNVRTLIVFNTAITFDTIVINNFHNNGTQTNLGIKSTKITVTEDSYTTATYDAAVTNGKVIFNGIIPEHPATNTEDDQSLSLTPNNKKLSVMQGTTQLPVEIGFWDSVNEKAILHTKLPIYDADADAELYLLFEKTNNDNDEYVGYVGDTISQTVWSNDYMLVLHKQDPTGTVYNSVNGDTLTVGGTPVLTADGIEFDGASDHLSHANSSAYDTTGQEFTIVAKFKRHDTGINSLVTYSANTVGNYDLSFSGGTLYLQWYNSGWQYSTDASFSALDTEYDVSATYDNGTTQIGKDGVLGTPDTGKAALLTSSSNLLYVARYTAAPPDDYAYITIFELRVSDVARSSDWLKLEYLSMNDQLITWEAVNPIYDLDIVIPAQSEVMSGFPIHFPLGNTINTKELLNSLKDTSLTFNFDGTTVDTSLWTNTLNPAASLTQDDRLECNIASGAAHSGCLAELESKPFSFAAGIDFSCVINFTNWYYSGPPGACIYLCKVGTTFDAYYAKPINCISIMLGSGSNYHRLSTIISNSGGTTTTDQISALAANTDHNVRVTIVGDVVTVYVEDVETLSTTISAADKTALGDDFYLAFGAAGYNQAGTLYIDDLTIDWETSQRWDLIEIKDASDNHVPIEVAKWDTENEVGHLIFKGDLATSEVTYYLNFNPANSVNSNIGLTGSAIAQTVWNSSFDGVWLMNQDPSGGSGCILDSTANSNHGTPTNMDSTNQIAMDQKDGLSFNGTDENVDFGDPTDFDYGTNDFSITIVAKADSLSSQKMFIGKDNGSTSRQFILMWRDDVDKIRWQIFSGSSGYNLDTAANSFPDTDLDEHVITAIRRSQTTLEVWVDGVILGTGSITAITMNSSTANLQIGSRQYSAYRNWFDGNIGETWIRSGADSQAFIEAAYESLTNTLFTISEGTGPPSTTTFPQLSWLNEDYSLSPVTTNLNFINLIYSVNLDKIGWLNLVYGLKLGAILNEYYGDAPVLKKFINEYYGDNPLVQRFFDERYGDARGFISYIDEQYRINPEVRSWVNELYAVCSKAFNSQINLNYDLMANNPTLKWFDEIYAINADSVIEEQSLIVTIDGVRVYPFHVNFEINRGSFKAFAEVHLADQESYLLAVENQSVLRIQDGIDDLYFQVEVPRELATPGETTYLVPAESKSRILERTEGLTEQFDSDLASNIVTELAGRYGISVSWEIDDWMVKAETLYANDETPYQIIKKLTDIPKAKLQPNPSGDLRVVKNMETDTTLWSTAAPTYYMTDQRNFFQTSEDVIERPGYNKYRISDYEQANYSAFLEEEEVSSSKKILKGYKIPYTGKDLILGHSGGSWVTIESFGWTEESITETIEIIQGSGNVSKPIYAKTDHDYKQTNLGAITYNEDGTITTEIVGQALVEITYTTKYWKWSATDPNIEDVQFWLEESE